MGCSRRGSNNQHLLRLFYVFFALLMKTINYLSSFCCCYYWIILCSKLLYECRICCSLSNLMIIYCCLVINSLQFFVLFLLFLVDVCTPARCMFGVINSPKECWESEHLCFIIGKALILFVVLSFIKVCN